ncbi:unnamed protein product [Symbiodinium natans]|uniref:DNA-directed DNA polymerase family A palm domain-containing protein n=1 Tax=Symbiodinium natans TaxID=878477 RepID=A0A812JZM8_9DINO|nr:unnamed protein product [Symbiodinium natans]
MLSVVSVQVTGRKADLIQRLCDPSVQVQARRRLPKKTSAFTLRGLGLLPVLGRSGRRSATSVTLEVLEALVEREESSEAQAALRGLLNWRQQEAQLGFLRSLQSSCEGSPSNPANPANGNARVHTRLNLNTVTGRLSTRSPNLQGEPKQGGHAVRSAVAAAEGQRLLVADYGQLELRLVAHLADCPDMISILSEGGDIHSRTAYRMFQEVQEAVDGGEVALDSLSLTQKKSAEEERRPRSERSADSELPPEPAPPRLPLVAERFPELRRRAKTLNFSLLYGKTAYSLGIEWDLSQGEAEKLIKRWFAAFPEIETWMQQLHEDADSNATAQAVTLLGRSRPLWRKSASGSFRERGRARRVAGNTPVQGSAADVVLSAMGRVEASPTLQEFGFRLILQIHDELVLEGPEKHAEEALSELVRLMEDPLPFKLKVPLKVNACHVQSWQDAKA